MHIINLQAQDVDNLHVNVRITSNSKRINGTTRIGHKLQEILRDMVNK